MKRIAVTGGRDYDDEEVVEAFFDALLDALGPFTLVNGMCRTGADRHAYVWARTRGVEVDKYPANWDKYKNAAGPKRNATMAKSDLDACVAFPGGRGTRNMVENCLFNDVPVWYAVEDKT